MNKILQKIKLRFQKRKPSVVRERREQIRTLEAIAVVFETLDKFAEGNLLYFDPQHHRVIISHVLANFYLYDDKAWQTFLGNVHQWAVFRYTADHYARLYNQAMADADAKAFAASSGVSDAAVFGGNPSLSGNPADRRLARLQAAAAFDDAHAAEQISVPDLQFIIIDETDGHPVVVADRKDGRYTTYPVTPLRK